MSKLVETLNKHKFIIIGASVLLVIIIVVVVVTSKKDDTTTGATNNQTGATNNQAGSTTPRTHEIEVKDGANLSLTINKGDTIIWKLSFPHNLAGTITSPVRISPGVTTYSKTFNEDFPGSTKRYEYRSGFQSNLSGTITVKK
jgi:hypothetical protein